MVVVFVIVFARAGIVMVHKKAWRPHLM